MTDKSSVAILCTILAVACFFFLLCLSRYVKCIVFYLQEKFTPAKYFSIDRVFRNETLDATHLAEFHQIEGVVADYNLTLGDLIGVLYEFFKKLGKFTPSNTNLSLQYM